MRNFMFYDCETTGFLPTGRIVQLASVVTNERGKDLLTMDMIVRPDGYEIPPETTDIHGISTEHAMDEGYHIADVLGIFNTFQVNASIMIAHNVSFDKRIMENEFSLMGWDFDDQEKPVPHFCTMKNSIQFCKLPSKHGYKWPRLEELYEIVMGKQMENAHNAMADVRAMIDIFFSLMEQGVFKI